MKQIFCLRIEAGAIRINLEALTFKPTFQFTRWRCLLDVGIISQSSSSLFLISCLPSFLSFHCNLFRISSFDFCSIYIFSCTLDDDKMMTNFQNFRICKAFVHFGTVLYFALSLFIHYSTAFSTETFLLGFRACTCIFDITWCCTGTDTDQNFESEL